MARIILLLRRIRGIVPMFKDKAVPWWKKAIIIAGIVYLILPVDLIPPLVPVFGWLDDIILWIAILYFMGTELESHMPGSSKTPDEDKYKYSNDAYEVNYTVIDSEVNDDTK